MRPNIKVIVGRNLDNRDHGLPDDSPLAWALHRKRGELVHLALEGEPAWKVLDWGKTDDQGRTHEDVEVVLELAEAAKTVALIFAGKVLYRVLEDTVVEALKILVKKFVQQLRYREVKRVYAELPDGIIVDWTSPGYRNDIDIWLISRVSLSINDLDGG